MIKPKLELKPGKVYTYKGTEGVYSIVAGEVLEGDAAPTMRYGEGPPGSGLGKEGDVYIDQQNLTLYTRGPGGWGPGKVFKGTDGRDGSNGLNGADGNNGNNGQNGVDGKSAISGYLTNESVAIGADDGGTIVSNADLAEAAGSFLAYDGIDRLYGENEVQFTVLDGITFGNIVTRTIEGLRLTINRFTGEYSVDIDPFIGKWETASSNVSFTLSAITTSGVTLNKVLTITKSKGGRDAKILTLTCDKYNFNVDYLGKYSPENQEIRLFAQRRNITNDVSWKVYWSDVDGNLYNLLPSDFSNYLTISGTGNTNGTFTTTHYDWILEKYPTAVSVRIVAEDSGDATHKDEITIGRFEGAPGGLSGVLSNESHISTEGDTGFFTDLSDAGGKFDVWLGSKKLTASDDLEFSVSADGEEFASTATKNGLSIEINSAGVYSLSISDPNTYQSFYPTDVFYIRATYQEINTVDKTYSLAKSRRGDNGEPAKFLSLSTSKATFGKKADGTYSAATAVVTVKLDNISGPNLTWEVSRVGGAAIVDIDVNNFLTIATDKISAQMTHTQFGNLLGNGTAIKIKVTDSASSLSDEIEIIPVADGPAGTAALSGYLTNESFTITAYSYEDGKISDDLVNAGGKFNVLSGITNISSDSGTSYEIVVVGSEAVVPFTDGSNGSGVALSRGLTGGKGLKLKLYTSGNYKGRYVIEEDEAKSWKTDGVTFDLKATYSGSTITKTYSINKSKSSSILNLRPSSYTFSLKNDGTVQNSSDKIGFRAYKDSLKKISGLNVSWEVWGVKSDGSLSTNALTTATYLTVKTGSPDQTEAEMTAAQFKAVRDISVTPKYVGAQVKATYDGASDVVTINAVFDGATGSTGAAGLTGYLTNESCSVSALTDSDKLAASAKDADGIITAGTGNFKITSGNTDITSDTNVSLSILDDSSTSEPDTTVTGFVSLTKNGLKLTLDTLDTNKGKYTLKENPKWTSTVETFSLVATYTSSTGTTTITKVFTVTKNFSGSDISVTPSSYVFNLKSDGTVKNSGDKIKFTAKTASAKLGNSAGTVTWEVWGVKADGTFSPNALDTMIASGDDTYLNVKGTPADLSVAEMTVTQFKAVCAQASNSYVSARVVCKFDGGAVSDEVTIQAALDGEKGAKGDTGFGVGQTLTLGMGRRDSAVSQTIYQASSAGVADNFAHLFFGDIHKTSMDVGVRGQEFVIPNGRGDYTMDYYPPNNTSYSRENTPYAKWQYDLFDFYYDTIDPLPYSPIPTSNVNGNNYYKGGLIYIKSAGYYRFDINASLELTHNKVTVDAISVSGFFKIWDKSLTLTPTYKGIGSKTFLLLPATSDGVSTKYYETVNLSKTIQLHVGDIIALGMNYKFINSSGVPQTTANYGVRLLADEESADALGGDTTLTITKVEKP